MLWPQSQDYNEAIQNPKSCFKDAELKSGQAVTNALGVPLPCSGNFADVYQVQGAGGKGTWAVKCFTRGEPSSLRQRYAHIDRYLHQVKLPFSIGFEFLDEGMLVRGKWHPVLKMQWVEGFALNQFVRDNLDKPNLLDALLKIWTRMAGRLREGGLAHADLQHGNVMLVPGSTASALGVKLIDYDGMWVPSLAGQQSGEVGHPAYQHPQRLSEGTYSQDVDRFPLLVVATALRCLRIGGRSLWEKYDNGDNLLFLEPDFKAPDQSPVFNELSKLPDPQAKQLVARLRQACQEPLEKAPLLDEVLPDLAAKKTTATTGGAIPPAAAGAKTASAESLFDGLGEDAPGALDSRRHRPVRCPRGSSSKRNWIIAGSAAAVVLVIGIIVALSSGGKGDNDEPSGSKDSAKDTVSTDQGRPGTRAITLEPLPDLRLPAGQSRHVTVRARGTDGAAVFIASLTGQPPGVEVKRLSSDAKTGEAVFMLTAAADAADAERKVDVAIRNGDATAHGSFQLIVEAAVAVNDPPGARLPRTVDLASDFRKLGMTSRKQGERNVSTLFALTALAEFEFARSGSYVPFSEEFMIWAANEGTGLKDDPAFFTDAIHGLNALGICSADLMLYADTSDAQRKPSDEAKKDALERAGRWKCEFIKRWDVKRKLDNRELRAIKQALADGHPVACGLHWPNVLRGHELLFVAQPEGVHDGHTVVLTGYEDDPKKPGGGVFRFRNSAGPEWGEAGHGVVSYAYARDYAIDAVWLKLGPPKSEIPSVRFELEALPVLAQDRFARLTQKMDYWGGLMWSKAQQMFGRAEEGAFLEVGFDIADAGDHRLRLTGTAAADYARISMALDGKTLEPEFDLYSGRVEPTGPMELGTHTLTAGRHRLRITVSGKNEVSTGYIVGLDTLDLFSPKSETPPMPMVVVVENKRKPVPEPAARDASLKTLKELFKAEYASAKAVDRKSLVDQLIPKYRDTARQDVAMRYVVLWEAADNAVRADNIVLAIALLGLLADEFDVDGLDLKLNALTVYSKDALTTARHQSLAEACFHVLDDARLPEVNLKALTRLADLAEPVAGRCQDLPTRTRLLACIQEARDTVKEDGPFREASTLLKTKADDGPANALCGKFLCLRMGEWDRGLAMLVKGDDGKWKDLAAADLAAPAMPEERVKAGEAWLAQSKSHLDPGWVELRRRAAHWFQQAGESESTAPLKERADRQLNLVKNQLARPRASPTGGELIKLEEHKGAVSAVAWFPDGARILSAGKDNKVFLWDGKSSKPLQTYNVSAGLRPPVVIDAEEFAGVNEITVFSWGVDDTSRFRTAFGLPGKLQGVAGTGRRGRFLIGNDRGDLMLSDDRRRDDVDTKSFPSGVTALASSANGNLALVGGDNGLLMLYTLNVSPRSSARLGAHSGPVRAVAMSRDGLKAASIGADKAVRLWDLSARKEMRKLPAQGGTVSCAAFSANGKWLVTGGEDATVRIWSVATGEELRRFVGHKGKVTGVGFSPDGKRVVSGGDDMTVRIWGL